MNKPTLFLLIGPKGTGKTRILQHIREKPECKNITIARTVVAPPIDMRHAFENNDHYLVVSHLEFRVRVVERTLKFMWKEFNEKQLEFSLSSSNYEATDKVELQRQQEEAHNMIYKGIGAFELENSIELNRDVLLCLSNSFMFKTKENMYIDSFKEQKFNLLKDVISAYRDRCNIKVIFVRSPKTLLIQRLQDLKIYNSDEIERIVAHGSFMQSQTTLEKCFPGDVTVSYIDNNATIEEASRRLLVAMISRHHKNEVNNYYTRKQQSEQYMKNHNVTELMEYLFNSVILQRPKDPVAHLINVLGNLKVKQKECFMDLNDIETMFDLIDINGRGTISSEQLLKTLDNLQVAPSDITQIKQRFKTVTMIDKVEFCNILSLCLDTLKDTPYC